MGLWREVKRHPPEYYGLTEAPPSELDGTPLEWFGVLYRRCALHFGWTPTQVDQMELWEIASSLGDATRDVEAWGEEYARLEAETEGESGTSGGSIPGVNYGHDILAQRVAAAKGEAPAPEARVMGPHEIQALMGQLRDN